MGGGTNIIKIHPDSAQTANSHYPYKSGRWFSSPTFLIHRSPQHQGPRTRVVQSSQTVSFESSLPREDSYEKYEPGRRPRSSSLLPIQLNTRFCGKVPSRVRTAGVTEVSIPNQYQTKKKIKIQKKCFNLETSNADLSETKNLGNLIQTFSSSAAPLDYIVPPPQKQYVYAATTWWSHEKAWTNN